MFRCIVVGTDGSDSARVAVSQAGELARTHGASLVLVAAFPETAGIAERLGGSARSDRVDLRATAESVLARAEREVGDAPEVDRVARGGDPAEVIIDVAVERDADLIVTGSKGMTGVGRFLLGSVPNKVSHHAPCTVMIVRTG